MTGRSRCAWRCGPGEAVRDRVTLDVMEPGDVIATGTPPGVGLGMKPEPKFLKAGDVVTLGINGLGEQRQKVVGPKA